MRSVLRRAVLGAVAAVVLAGCGTKTDVSPQMPESPVSPGAASGAPSATEQLPPAELQGRWWSWAATEPWATNPVADKDGSDCTRNQPSDVWFLAGTFGGHVRRTCTVPPGTPLAFPLVNRLGGPDQCRAFMATAEGSAKLDGVEIDVARYAYTDVTMTASAENPVTTDGGTFLSGACGLWAQVPPLNPGKHSVSLTGRSGGFTVSVDYSLTVEPTR